MPARRSIVTGRRTAWAVALVPLLLALAVIGGVGEAHAYPSTSLTQKDDMAVVPALQAASQRAFAMAGITTEQIDALMIHEGFTWYVIAALEARWNVAQLPLRFRENILLWFVQSFFKRPTSL